jgi:predicted GNAT family acetyltransferase
MTTSFTLAAADTAALDHPIWSALNSGNRAIALGDDLARRYPAEIAPFAAMREATPEAYAALHALLGSGYGVLFTTEPLAPPSNLAVQFAASGYQMVATRLPDRPSGRHEFAPLTAADIPAMQELVELTKPGPFAARTIELGTYLGVRSNGKLAAMAGERMRLAGQVEISAVCVHPEHRGHGYARDLILALMQRQIERSMLPMLHVFASNAAAIALYEQIGFAVRQTLHVTGLKRA